MFSVIPVVLLAITCGSLLVVLFFRGSKPPETPHLRSLARELRQTQLIMELEGKLLISLRQTEEAFRAGFRAMNASNTPANGAWTFDVPNANAAWREQQAWDAYCRDRGPKTC